MAAIYHLFQEYGLLKDLSTTNTASVRMVSAFASAIFDSLICIHHVGVRVLAEMSSLLTQQRKLHFNLATVTNIAVSHPLDLEQLYLLHPLCMTFSSSVC